MVTPHAREAEVVVVITDAAVKARVKDKARAMLAGMVVAMASKAKARDMAKDTTKAKVVMATSKVATAISPVAMVTSKAATATNKAVTATREGAGNNAVKVAEATDRVATKVAMLGIKVISNAVINSTGAVFPVLLLIWQRRLCQEPATCRAKSNCSLPHRPIPCNSPPS